MFPSNVSPIVTVEKRPPTTSLGGKPHSDYRLDRAERNRRGTYSCPRMNKAAVQRTAAFES